MCLAQDEKYKHKIVYRYSSCSQYNKNAFQSNLDTMRHMEASAEYSTK